ncbi:uncharacterized protein EDB91DRAFT_1149734 [Suillus paluster]|uniref:uncharacterized protein n=1 Tax=Suillus paluster TaxID=48578 RepID=UPI001B882EB1|nr:uncharacterized protein EDB91DRAFT_1149734 [Suillus paluster]KAG1733006.1 hypothetical protein EDB91DRAFT_1149734 [Suillus paluster]
MPQTRAQTTTSSPVHVSTAPTTNSSPSRASPNTRSRGPASGEAITAQPRVRTPLTIRLPRAALVGHPAFLATNNASAASVTAIAAASAAAAAAAAAPIPTSSIRSSLSAPAPSPAPPIRAPPPTPSNVSKPASTSPARPILPAPTPVTSAPTPTPVSSTRVAAPPIYTFSSTPYLLPITNAAAAPSPLSRQPVPNPLLSPALTNAPASTSPRPPTPPTSSDGPLPTSSLAPLRSARRMQPMVSAAKQASREAALAAGQSRPAPASPQAQYPTPSSAGALPSPASNADIESDYAADPMDVDMEMESISTMKNGRNNSTAPKTSEKHREANKKYRQRLKERIKNGEIDEIEAERMKERKRTNARNSRIRRKLAMSEAAKDSTSMSSVEPGLHYGPGTELFPVPPVDPSPSAGDFLLCMPETNPPAGSYYSTTFHEILTRASNLTSGSSDGASITHPHFEPDSASLSMSTPALFPTTKSRDLRDACTMTDSTPDSPKENESYASLEPIAPALARRPHRQLTPERLRHLETHPLELIDKAFLLIVPDPSSSLGKLVLCKVIEHRVSAAGHRFLVQFWGDKRASEMGVERMMEVLCGGYEIDPPPVGGNGGDGSQGVGLAGRVFGALRSFTGL